MERRRFDNDDGDRPRGRNNFSGRSGDSRGRNNFSGRSNFGGRNNFSGAPREMHKAICAKCKKECEVPFKPTEGRDVFCRDCFVKSNPRR